MMRIFINFVQFLLFLGVKIPSVVIIIGVDSKIIDFSDSMFLPRSLKDTTEPSTKLYCLRTCNQTMISTAEINLVNWGCKLDGNELVVLMCDMNAAPDSLPKIIHCNCKTGFSGRKTDFNAVLFVDHAKFYIVKTGYYVN